MTKHTQTKKGDPDGSSIHSSKRNGSKGRVASVHMKRKEPRKDHINVRILPWSMVYDIDDMVYGICYMVY